MANILGKVFMTPKDEWVLTKKYEKLDIVTVTNSTSVSAYIAKDDIPENTQITDSKWMKLFTVTNGKNGTNGAKGDTGASGKAATIAVGSVTSGSVAKITNSGNTNAAVFDFVLPKGDKGDAGAQGETGAKGDKGSPGANVRTSSKTITEGTNLRADVNGSVNVGDTVIDVNGDVYTVNDKDDTNFTASKKVTSIKGTKGDAGAKGATGAAGAKGASVKSITLTKDSGGVITGGTATLTDNTTVPITVTTAGA